VSLLEAGEVEELGLHREAGLCHDLDLEFIAFPVPDGGVPASTRETMALAEAVVARPNEGKAVAVHCRAGAVGVCLILAALRKPAIPRQPRNTLAAYRSWCRPVAPRPSGFGAKDEPIAKKHFRRDPAFLFSH
jgi:hypothetical protein